MSCIFCDVEIGDVVNLEGGDCSVCESLQDKYVGTYVGRQGQLHVFRVHNHRCNNCGTKTRFATAPCSYSDGIDVTEEFQVMNVRRTSHWIGE